MKIYLAGPDVFLPDAEAVGRRKCEICERHGLEGLFPLDNTLSTDGSSTSFNIFRANTALMQEAEAVIANLTPFRGPSADAGTIYELGYMAGLGKLCAGYSNVAASYLDKVRALDTEASATLDKAGLTIEDFGLAENLMIVHALDAFGLPLVVPQRPVDDPLRDLAAFEACVKSLSARQRSNKPRKRA